MPGTAPRRTVRQLSSFVVHPSSSLRGAALLIVGAFLALGLTYTLVTPIFETPDEVEHFEFVRHIARTGTLPDMRSRGQPWAQEGSQPPLYYLTAAAPVRLFFSSALTIPIPLNPHARIGQPEAPVNKNRVAHGAAERFPWRGLAGAVHMARLVSLLWSILGVLGVYTLGRLAFAEHIKAALATALVAFLPQFAFVGGAVSNDPANMAAVAWLLAVLWYAAERGPSPRLGMLAGVIGGVAALCKLSGLVAAAFGFAFLAIQWWPQRRARRTWLALAGYGVAAAAVAGWWYARNLVIYGDPSGLKPMLDAVGRYRTPLTAPELFAQLQGVWRSFWGVFGWFNIELPGPVYTALGVATIIALLGGLRGLWIVDRGSRISAIRNPQSAIRAPWLLLWIVIILAALANWMRTTPGAQGRLLFPALPALGVLAAWCWQGWRGRMGTWGGWVMAGGLAILSAAIPFGVIRPAYVPPPLLSALPADAIPLDVTYGGQIRLLGYRLAPAQLTPGDDLTVTLFWRSMAPIAENYSVFVHLVGADTLLVAQNDSFPAGGAWATSQWPIDAIVADTHRIPVPATTYAPDEIALRVGLYQVGTRARLLASPPAEEESVPIAQLVIRPRPGVVPNATCINYGGQFKLVGYEMERRVLHARDTIRITLYWQADQQPTRRYTSSLQVLGEGDRIWGQRDSQPLLDLRTWKAGKVIRDHKEFQISADAPPGLYDLRVGLYDTDTYELEKALPGEGCLSGDVLVLTRVRVLPRVR